MVFFGLFCFLFCLFFNFTSVCHQSDPCRTIIRIRRTLKSDSTQLLKTETNLLKTSSTCSLSWSVKVFHQLREQNSKAERKSKHDRITNSCWKTHDPGPRAILKLFASEEPPNVFKLGFSVFFYIHLNMSTSDTQKNLVKYIVALILRHITNLNWMFVPPHANINLITVKPFWRPGQNL